MSVPPFDDACRVCGFDIGGGWDGGQPMYIICSCCGAESGLDDHPTRTALGYLIEWVVAGTPWFDPAEKPDHWNLRDQLHRAGLRRPIQRLDAYENGSYPGNGPVDRRFPTKPFWLRRSQEGQVPPASEPSG